MSVNDEIPRSRLTLTYRTDVQGKQVPVELPFRGLIMADLTLAQERAPLEEKELKVLDGTNLNDVMEGMGIHSRFRVENRIDAERSADIDVDIPITSMKSFQPAEIAKAVPKTRALLLLKRLLVEVQSDIDNQKAFRTLLRELGKDEEALKALVGELEGYDDFRLPAGALKETSADGDDE